MPKPFRQRTLESGFELATLVIELDPHGWIKFLTALLLTLITVFAGYDHVGLLGTASIDIPQQAGIPRIAAAVATAFAEAQLASNDRQRSEAIRARAEDFSREESDRADQERNRAAQERERAARSEQCQARALRAGALVWLNPTPLNRRFLELVAAELAERV